MTFLMDICYSHFWTKTSSSRWPRTRIFVIVSACFLILYDDYRLTVNGLLFSIGAVFLAGIARIFYRASVSSLRSTDGDIACKTYIFATVVLSALITGTWIYAGGDKEEALVTSLTEQCTALLINLVTSSVCMIMGGSIFIPMNDMTEDHESNQEKACWMTSHSLLMFQLTGLCAYVSLRGSCSTYISMFQILAFFCAIGCTSGSFASTVSQPQAPTIELYNPVEASSQFNTKQSKVNITSVIEEELNSADELAWARRRSQHRIQALRQTLAKLLSTILLVLVATAWIWFIIRDLDYVSFGSTKSPRPTTPLDTAYIPSSQFDVVVSMYQEPVQEIIDMMTELNGIPSIAVNKPRLLIYTKDQEADTDMLKEQTGAADVIKLPNVGREGESYLQHIVSHWDDLAKHTLFVQADIHNAWQFYRRIRQYYLPEATGMLSLGFSGSTCNCDECDDRFSWSDTSGIIAGVYEKVYNETCDGKPVLLSYKGQFIASAGRIRANARSLYQDLDYALVDAESWAHQDEYLQGRTDSLNAPYFGYTLERLWSIMMHCSDAEVAAKCPTLLSGTRRWGSPRDCQCLDEAPVVESSPPPEAGL